MPDGNREPPPVESEAYQKIRAWRAAERKTMVESMDRLLSQALRMAESRYTRSAQRARWTRLAGQLLWYKDQILRAMTWEALEEDVKEALRDQYQERPKEFVLKYPAIKPATVSPFQTTIIKKKEDDEPNRDSYTDDSSKNPVA